MTHMPSLLSRPVIKKIVTALFAAGMMLLVQPPALSQAVPPLKVLRTSLRTAETGFDPQRITDLYSTDICWQIFEPVLDYDYLARPVKLVAGVAREVPVPEQAGRVYTFHIKPGIFFAADPAFKGRQRELVAKDLEYSLKRLRDPSLNAPYSWLVENKIVGLDELAAQAKRTGKMDFDAPVAGLQLLDRYTLRITLTGSDYNFLYIFAMPQTAPVAREVIEIYADDTMAHPVGTGPFRLTEWVRKSKIVLERNPTYRGVTLNTQYADANNEWDREVVASISGKRLPLLDRVEIYPIEEEQPRFLSFLNNQTDTLDETSPIYMNQVAPNNVLAPNLAKQGIRAFREVEPELTYDEFNIENPVVGGYDAQHVALRRAMVLGHHRDQEIRIIRSNRAMAAQSPIPPGVVGYDSTFTARDQNYDAPRAKALLDMVGYIDRDGDGYREQPDGTPLVIDYLNATGLQYTKQAELWVKSMQAIGIRLVNKQEQFADLLRDQQVGKFMFTGAAWIADYPDGQNFLQLLYGPNTGSSNRARFKLPAYDQAYAKALTMPDSPERNALYREMSRLILAYAPWRLGVHRSYTHLVHPWVHGYDRHPIAHTRFLYLDVDVAAQQAARD
jgi:oligopeptide transport system substrate-binding protein